MLLRSEKNRLYLACQQAAVPLDELTYEEVTPYRHRVVVRSNRGLWLSVEKTATGKFQIWQSAFSLVHGAADVQDAITVPTMDHVLELLLVWLANDVTKYLAERDTPDYWTQLASASSTLPLAANDIAIDDDAEFTFDERQRLGTALNTFRVKVAHEFRPSPAEQRDIDARLDRLARALEQNTSRFDWRGIALSALIGIATTLSLGPEQGQQLLSLFRSAVFEAFRLLR